MDCGKSRGIMSSCKILRQIKNMRTCLGENSIEHLIMTFSCPLVFLLFAIVQCISMSYHYNNVLHGVYPLTGSLYDCNVFDMYYK